MVRGRSERPEPIDRFLELSDVLCPNETELATLCERNVDPENDDSVCEGARELISRGTYCTTLVAYCCVVFPEAEKRSCRRRWRCARSRTTVIGHLWSIRF